MRLMKRSVIFASVACLLIVGLLVFFYEKKGQGDGLVLYGNVDVRQVDIGFRVAGQVDKVLFEEGDQVRAGDLLTTLDKSPYDQQLNEARAAVRVAEAGFVNAERLFNRRKELIDVGGVSVENLQDIETSYLEARAQLEQAKAAEAVARDNLDFTKAFCPTEGVILTRIREPGTVLNPSDPVYTISISSPVWVRAYVDEPQLGKVHFGQSAEIHTDTRGGKVYMGKVGFISPVAEFTPKTVQTTQLRTDLVYRLRIYADNPDWGLKQGMPVTVKLLP